MIRLAALLAGIIGLIFFWYECGEDFAVFCYRIGLGAFTSLRLRALVPVPVRDSSHLSAARNNIGCSTLSFTSSTRSITRKDSRS